MNSEDRSLDQALDEIDRWSERMVRELEGLTPDQRSEYFKRAKAEFEEKLGRPLNLPIRKAPAKEPAS
jgi:hypothetical protein